jgi:AcrR family transcriptional regulator
MDFLRARTQEQIASRQEEIINACDVLFSANGYEAVNFKAISEMTLLTRPSIYNYYKTKDEVLLDLLKREMLHWQTCFISAVDANAEMTKEQYSTCLTEVLSSHDKMLKLLSILFTFLEKNSGVEKLADFKKEVMKVFDIVMASLDKYFSNATVENKAIFVSAFFAYIIGLYPLSHLSQKQLEAMQRAGIDFTAPDFQHMCYRGILLLLSEL